jgi:hypothetical protein
MRTIFLSSLLIAFCHASAQEDKKISYVGPVGPASRVLAEIGKQNGVSLVTSPQTQNDVIGVAVSDVTLGELLKKIGDATGNVWRKDSEGYRLIRDNTVDRNLKAESLKNRSVLVAKAIEKIIEDSKKKAPPPQESFSTGNAVFRVAGPDFGRMARTPGGKAILALIQALGPDELAKLEDGKRVVYASAPNMMQKPIPGNTSAKVASTLATEQKEYLKNRPADGPNGMRLMTPENDLSIFDGDASKGIGKLLLIVSRASGQSELMFQVMLSDREGKSLAGGNLQLAVEKGEQTAIDFEAKKITPDPATSELARALNPGGSGGAQVSFIAVTVADGASGGESAPMEIFGGGSGSARPRLSPELTKHLLEPEKSEPASFGWTEAIATLAQQGQDVVAAIPDSAIRPLISRLAGEFTTKQLLNAATNWGVEPTISSGWIVFKPGSIPFARDHRFDRGALGRLLKVAEGSGLVSLVDMAAYASTQAIPPTFTSYERQVITWFTTDSPVNGFGFDSSNWSTLRLFASLSVGQRQALGSGQSLPFRNFSPYQIGIVNEEIFHSMAGPNYRNPNPTGGIDRRQVVVADGFMITDGSFKLAQERTEMLPTGVPAAGYLRVASTTDVGVVASDSKTGSRQVMTAGSIAFRQNQAENPQMASFMQGSNFDQYRQVSIARHNFAFELSPSGFMRRNLQDVAPIGASNKPVAYDQLPADFRKRVDEMRKRTPKLDMTTEVGEFKPPHP